MSEWTDGYRAALVDMDRFLRARALITDQVDLLLRDMLGDALVIERQQDNQLRRRRLAVVREAELPLFEADQ